MANINQNRWDQLLRRVAGLIGPGSKVDNTIGDLFPMLDVENVPGELLLLSGYRLGMAGGTFTPAAGERQQVQLFNPDRSGLLVVIEDLYVSGPATQSFNLVPTRTQFVSQPGSENERDTRLTASQITAVLGELSSGAAASSDLVFRELGNTTFRLTSRNGIAVLAPGTGLNIEGRGIDIALDVGFFFRERVAEQSELNF